MTTFRFNVNEEDNTTMHMHMEPYGKDLWVFLVKTEPQKIVTLTK